MEVNSSLFYYKFITLSLKICECQAFPTFYNAVLLQYGQVLIRIKLIRMLPKLTWNYSELIRYQLLRIAPCKVIRIPESRKFLLVESGILGSGIQNPAFGIQDPAKKGIQNPLAENPFQIVLAAFTRIHATTVECSSLTLSIGAQSELSNPTGFAWNINMAAIWLFWNNSK